MTSDQLNVIFNFWWLESKNLTRIEQIANLWKVNDIPKKTASADDAVAPAPDVVADKDPRRALSESTNIPADDEEAAATRIQAGFTGMMVRQQLQGRPMTRIHSTLYISMGVFITFLLLLYIQGDHVGLRLQILA